MPQSTILDHPDETKRIDKENMVGLCERTPEFCKDALRLAEEAEIPYKQPGNIVVAGMGGSAIGGELLKDWLCDKVSIPIEVCRDYALPAYTNENTLVVAISYSGETEETLNAFLQAVKRRCMVATVSSGGSLRAFSRRLGAPHVQIPEGFHPRAAIAYLFFPLVKIMEKVGISKETAEVEETLRVLRKISRENAQQIPLNDNSAKRLATQVMGTIPVVYGFRQYSAVARRLKCQFNENSKVPSKFDVFPELNHNEVVGWETRNSLTKAFSAIFIRDSAEPPEIRQRIDITEQIVSPNVCKTLEIHAEGKRKLTRMLSAMYVGDFASLYLALLRRVNPASTKTIVYLKKEIKRKLDLTTRFEEEMKRLQRPGK